MMQRILVSLLALLAVGAAEAAVKVSVQALFKDKAILSIDGQRRVLKSGEVAPEGVRLVATDTRDEVAVLETEGRRETLRLGAVSAPSTTPRASVLMQVETNGHFRPEGLINGQPVRFMVDTGATHVALSSDMADRLGVDYKRYGRPATAQTAAGQVATHVVKLNSVQVGGITQYNVDATIISGGPAGDVLLGMSFLGNVEMKHDGQTMQLTER
jgi:aspartyl protease family protein